MKGLKERLNNLYLVLKKAVERFPVTIVIILTLTLIFAINFDNDFIDYRVLNDITLFGVTFAFGTFYVESTFEKMSRKKIIGYIISNIIAIFFTLTSNIESESFSDYYQDYFDKFMVFISKLLICYMISTFVLSVYNNYKKSKKTFEEYVTHTLVNTFKSSIIFAILAAGIAAVTAIFIYLILDGDDFDFIIRMEILLLGGYFIPTILYSFYNMSDEITKFAKIVIKYVFGTLLICAFAIIYMYIIKIIILMDMPSNQIFRILAVLFVSGLPIWTMISIFKEDKFIDKLNKKLPILFIPFILLQIYSIGIRIIYHGITEPRYLCVMLIIFEIIYTILYIKKREKIAYILPVFVAMTLISLIVPYVNMFKVSEMSQYSNLKIYKQKTNYTAEEKDKIYGAYRYLKYSENGEEYINSLLTESDKEKIKDFNKEIEEIYEDKTEYIYANLNLDSLDIDGYKTLYVINSSKYNIEKSINDTFKSLQITIGDNNEKMNIDVLDRVNQYISYGEKLDEKFEYCNEIELENGKKIILNYFSLEYNPDDKMVSSYRIKGYLLEK